MNDVEFYAITYSSDGLEYKESYEDLEDAKDDFNYYVSHPEYYDYAVLQYVRYEDGYEYIEIIDDWFN